MDNTKSFKDMLLERLHAEFVGYDFRVEKIVKNNDFSYDGVCIRSENGEIFPVIPFARLEKRYKEGKSMEAIVESFREAINSELKMDFYYVMEFENVKESIMLKVVNFDMNSGFLETVPHRRYLDLAVAYTVEMPDKENENKAYSVMVSDKLMKVWGVTEEELYRIAQKNYFEKMPTVIRDIRAVILELMGIEVDEKDLPADGNEENMYMMSNRKNLNGAAAILDTEVINNFAKKVGRNLYILPSSTHELIIVPEYDNLNKKELLSLVKYNNKSVVCRMEWLSHNIYYYDMNSNNIEIVMQS